MLFSAVALVCIAQGPIFITTLATNDSASALYRSSTWSLLSLCVALTVTDSVLRHQASFLGQRERWLGVVTLVSLIAASLAGFLVAAALQGVFAPKMSAANPRTIALAVMTMLHWSALAFLCLAFPLSRAGLAFSLVLAGWILPRSLEPSNIVVIGILRLLDTTRHLGSSPELLQPWWGGAVDMTQILALAFVAMLVRARWPRAS